ncbi:hypothetical protein [Pontibacter virosus]|uniref:Uncharacterized protein n=1 Tax=Pontibacter virosus TaxID=1765052 RepID=A0A2U1AY56_9BACT|nr:hypothetical protein [Pontibacter virosus]PVY41374.1 hypothetical protein C8E01_105303 [Pontibacter virosus]
MKKLLIVFLSFIGSLVFFILFGFIVGFPTFQDNYVEAESNKSDITILKSQTLDGKVSLIPEVLNRLILEIKFQQSSSENYIVKDLDVECDCTSNKSNIDRIFYIRVSKYDPEVDEFFSDETRIEESYTELPLNSKYRDLSYTISPQFALNGCDEFDLTIKASLVDTLSNEALQIDKTSLVKKNSDFKWERFRAH